ncbi:multiple epidermal growth factor-like domains protein 11 [Haliotis rubra]|uniref:multiple epidermal growth factor-like domains protein 11 n=1 Tax=Haliotis rubra TaxID=36100 RepID=UPI001EE587C9|nr:multiple epidermal growth factor-like domains protein 11 [Haliotis rubra]XP_046556317.1 multiple epidermal growth factor-like domains protein 11 [Haliotis rubra]
MNSSNHEIILTQDLDEPRDIVVHEARRRMYWTDRGASPHISTANYDGTNIRKIVSTGLTWPNGFTIDKKNGILYWCDAKTHTVESVSVDGAQRKILVYEPDAHYFRITYHDGALYFTDWSRRAVLNMPATGGIVGLMTIGPFTQLAGIRVFSNRNSTGCPSGQYGEDCRDCGNCQKRSVCEKTTGWCIGGCATGYQGNNCSQICSSGTYGERCALTCGNCTETTCNHVNGTCPLGCNAGWTGHDCKTALPRCPTNTYGPGCSACGKCAGGVSCNTVSGVCPAGCELGWKGDTCEIACLPNTYDASCDSCGQCAAAVPCDNSSGVCPAGCQDGWTGSLCKTSR